MINQHIKGTPKAQPRVKATMRGRHAGVYTPKTADEWKHAVAFSLRPYSGRMIEGSFTAELCFFFARPKSHYGTGRNKHSLKDSAPGKHTQKPDVDNLAKAVLDVLTNIKFWKDDSQLVKLTIRKAWDDAMDEGMMIDVRLEKRAETLTENQLYTKDESG